MASDESPAECDYLIVGGGATGLAFADSLLAHWKSSSSSSSPSPSVVIADVHSAPGGQWNDSYDFVRLHQPSAGYGVETERLEPEGDAEHLASREEILEYYQRVVDKLRDEHGTVFVGKTKVDLSESGFVPVSDDDGRGVGWKCRLQRVGDGAESTIVVRKRLVDARYLQPDLPVDTKPTFKYDGSKTPCVPINDLVDPSFTSNNEYKRYVVIGGGKTGMDAVHYLLTTADVSPKDVMWVRPNEMWITARENIGSCMELLHDAAVLSKKAADGDGSPGAEEKKENKSADISLDRTFLEWEKRGRVYRLDTESVPTKFRDATLDGAELETLRKVAAKNAVRTGGSRVREIRPSDGALVLADGSVVELSFPVEETLYVHCSAGAFNYTKQSPDAPTPPVFAPGKIVIQDVYGTPGFCFVGSLIGRVEALDGERFAGDEARNGLCLAPQNDTAAAGKGDAEKKRPDLGPSGGDLGAVDSADHGLVQRLTNLRNWRHVPELRTWLDGHRLFNLKGMNDEAVGELVEETWTVLRDARIVT